jgi:hypothetical protein
MPAFTSGRYPQLQVNTVHGTVRFVDGRAEATEEQAEVLRGMGADYQLAEENVEGAETRGSAPSAPPAPVDPARPPQSAPKADWVEWAASHGMDRDQAEDLTKAELIELADQLTEE